MVDYRENNKWTVYVHISPSNKYYVGVTSQKLSQRWRNGKGYIKNIYFYRAIEKYGWENFEHFIFAEKLTKYEACEMEKTLIKELKSNDYHYGYNICSGGEGMTGLYGDKNPNYGKYWTDEQKQKMSKYNKGRVSPMLGKKHSQESINKIIETRRKNGSYKLTEEHKEKISKNLKERWNDENYKNNHSGKNHCCYGRVGDKHPMYGRHGFNNPNSKAVICLNTNTVYGSATIASEKTNINHSKLCMCCRGKRKSCGKDENNKPLHWKFYTDYLKENNLTDEEARKSLFFID